MLVSERMFELRKQIDIVKEELENHKLKLNVYQVKINHLRNKIRDIDEDIEWVKAAYPIEIPFGKTRLTHKKALDYMKKEVKYELKEVYEKKKGIETKIALKKIELANLKAEYKSL